MRLTTRQSTSRHCLDLSCLVVSHSKFQQERHQVQWSLPRPLACVQQKDPLLFSLALEAERYVWILCCPFDPSTAGPPAACSLSSACHSPERSTHTLITGTLHTYLLCCCVCANLLSSALSLAHVLWHAHTRSLTYIKHTQNQHTCQLAADSEASSLRNTREVSFFSATREEDGRAAPEMLASGVVQ